MAIEQSLACATLDDFIAYLTNSLSIKFSADMASHQISETDKLRFLYRCDLAIKYMDIARDKIVADRKTTLKNMLWSCMPLNEKKLTELVKNINVENYPFELLLHSLPESYKKFGCVPLRIIERKNYESYLQNQLFHVKRAKLNALLEDTIAIARAENRNMQRIMRHIKRIRLLVEEIAKSDFDDEEKLQQLEQTVINCYGDVKLNQGMFELSTDLLANKLEHFMMSSSGLNLPYRYGHKVALPYPISRARYNNVRASQSMVPILSQIRWEQTERFNNKVASLFNSDRRSRVFNLTVMPRGVPTPRSLYEYMQAHQFLFADEIEPSSAEIFNKSFHDFLNQFGKKTSKEPTAAECEEYEKQILELNERAHVYDDDVIHEFSTDRRHIARMRIILVDLAKQNREERDEILSWIAPRDMDEDKKCFPFTCAYQKLKIQLSKSRLRTHKGPLIARLMEQLEKIRVMMGMTRQDMALDESVMTNLEKEAMEYLQYEISQTYQQVVGMKKICFFESNLATALAKFMREEFNICKDDLLVLRNPPPLLAATIVQP